LKEAEEAATGKKVRYQYDTIGRRLQREELNAGGGVVKTTRYLYEQWNCVAEFDVATDSSMTRSKTYTWGLDLSQSKQGAGGVGGLCATVDEANSTKVYHYSYDGNGNVHALYEDDFIAAAEYEYSPFGQTVAKSGVYADENEYRFSTKPEDDLTQLNYYGYRWYDSQLGRWPRRDPIGENGGLNLYGFINNDSVGNIDILGLLPPGEYSPREWYDDWLMRNPNTQRGSNFIVNHNNSKIINRIKLGCIGLTCVEMGDMPTSLWSNCYRSRMQALYTMMKMIENKTCCSRKNLNGDASSPRMFAMHLWNGEHVTFGGRDVTFDSKTQRANFSNYDQEPNWEVFRSPYASNPRSGLNYDFGYVDNNGNIVNANNGMTGANRAANNSPMRVYVQTIQEWQKGKDGIIFNEELWCVACESDALKRAPR